MRKRIFNILSLISLILFLATAGLWVRSYHRQGWMKWTQRGSSRCYALLLGSYPGRLAVAIGWQAADAAPLKRGDWTRPPMATQAGYRSWSGDSPRGTDRYDAYAMTLPQRPDLHQFAGLAWYADYSYTSSWHLLVPHRYIVLLAAALPLRWVQLKRREIRSRPPNLCKTCGYDIRATPDASGPLLERCPECGEAAVQHEMG